jgi:hypothetical protein
MLFDSIFNLPAKLIHFPTIVFVQLSIPHLPNLIQNDFPLSKNLSKAPKSSPRPAGRERRKAIRSKRLAKGKKSVLIPHSESNHKALAREHSQKMCKEVSSIRLYRQQVEFTLRLNLATRHKVGGGVTTMSCATCYFF